MQEALVQCQKCGHRFVAKLFEPGEAEHKGIRGFPLPCEKCGGPVKRVAN